MKNIMIDIETFGTTNDAVILQVGLVCKDINDIWRERLYFNVNVEEQIKLGRTIDAETVAWWISNKVSDSARASVLSQNKAVSFKDAMTSINEFIEEFIEDKSSKDDVLIWANSPQFDLSIIRSAMKSVGVEPAWKYYQERDYRTVKWLGKLVGIKFDDVENSHDAVSDATNQLGILNEIILGMVTVEKHTTR